MHESLEVLHYELRRIAGPVVPFILLAWERRCRETTRWWCFPDAFRKTCMQCLVSLSVVRACGFKFWSLNNNNTFVRHILFFTVRIKDQHQFGDVIWVETAFWEPAFRLTACGWFRTEVHSVVDVALLVAFDVGGNVIVVVVVVVGAVLMFVEFEIAGDIEYYASGVDTLIFVTCCNNCP